MSKRKTQGNILAMALYFLVFSAYACPVPKPGYGYQLGELINRSARILVVELTHIEKTSEGFIYSLKPIEVIKGKDSGLVKFYGYSSNHEGATYSDHNDEAFWFPNIGRSDWPCCICGPDHTFAKGYQYLIFPDLFGARKSAEIIRTNDDRWYKFVKDRVKSQSTPKN